MALILTLLVAMAQPATLPAPPAPATVAAACRALDQRQGLSPENLHNLATCLFRGDGFPQDLVRARGLYRQAAVGGYVKAQCALGNMLIAGQGGDRDVPAGLALCRRAAEAGNADAQTDLGGYLLTGEFMPKDAVEARRWLTLAARQRQANAAFLLGQIYWNGDGIATDKTEAARWWRVAHEGGRADAAFLLGRETMARVIQSATSPERLDRLTLAEALRWFDLAAETDPSETLRARAREGASLLRQLQSAR